MSLRASPKGDRFHIVVDSVVLEEPLGLRESAVDNENGRLREVADSLLPHELRTFVHHVVRPILPPDYEVLRTVRGGLVLTVDIPGYEESAAPHLLLSLPNESITDLRAIEGTAVTFW